MKNLQSVFITNIFIIFFVFCMSLGKNLRAEILEKKETKKLKSFIVTELQNMQNIFQDQNRGEGTDGVKDNFMLSSIALRITGKAGIELPNVAHVEFEPSIEVYWTADE